MREIGIEEAARLLIEERGDEAELHAATKAAVAHSQGDQVSCNAWRAILDAVVVLRESAPGPTRH